MKGMKNKISKLLAVGLSGALFAGLGAGCGNNDGKTEAGAASYVAIDVNPSLSLVLDKNDKVVSVVADNEDAQVLLYGETVVGLSVEDAAKKIAELSVDLGYLNDSNFGVNITVEGKADSDKLTKSIQSSFTACAGDLNLNFSSEGTFSANRELKAIQAAYSSDAAIQGLTAGKLKLILEAQSVDNTLTLTAAANMDASELISLIANAADRIEPYATEAYTTAKAAASYTYELAKGSLLDSIWLAPYLKDYAGILTGEKKYDVNYGAIYNLYASSSRTLKAGLDAAEAAAALAEKTEVSDVALDAIAAAMGMSDEEKADFISAVSKEGKTVAALDKYFNTYFKNMTAEARAEAKAKMDAVMEKVQEEADKIDAAVAQEYKDALNKLCSDLTALIPDSIIDTANAYMTEFKGMISDLEKAVTGKEPMPAAYAALKAVDEREEKIMETMKSDLTKEDLESVNKAIAAINDKLTSAEKAYNDALQQAEQTAKDYLAALKEARKGN